MNNGVLEWRGNNQQAFTDALTGLVQAAGQDGCGYEASLEAWYRFLIDPEPYLSAVRVPCSATDTNNGCVATQGLDQDILNQRAAFLRDNSLVAVIMLSDENDCSIRVGAQNWIAAAVQNSFREFAPTSDCAGNPNAMCCHSCGQSAPAGCPATDTRQECLADPANPAAGRARLALEADQPNVRCWDQKERFGVDFLYPVERYINALIQPRLCTARADLSPIAPTDPNEAGCRQDSELRDNPLFRRLNPATNRVEVTRNPDLVFFAGIIGVPWQLIQASGNTDGDDYPPNQLRFLTAEQLNDPTLDGNPNNVGWQEIKADPHMIESIAQRGGLPGANAPFDADPVHGHERDIVALNDLQYACILPLPATRQCAGVDRGCDCAEVGDADPDELNNPLCQDANDDSYSTMQQHAKAFPGLRHLDVLQGFGERAIVASICARNVDFQGDQGAQDLGYRPAVDAIIDRLKEALSNRCVSRPLAATMVGETATGGNVALAPCSLVEVQPGGAASCNCEAIEPLGTRRTPVPEVSVAVRQRAFDVGGQGCEDANCASACLCALSQLGAPTDLNDPTTADLDSLESCQYDIAPGNAVQGWCYVDPAGNIGNPALVAECPANQRQILRFVPETLLRTGTTTFVACFGAAPGDDGRVIQVTQGPTP